MLLAAVDSPGRPRAGLTACARVEVGATVILRGNARARRRSFRQACEL